jgi:hypothetical protein
LKINKYCYLLHLVGLDFIKLPTWKVVHIEKTAFLPTRLDKCLQPVVASKTNSKIADC